MSWSAAQIAAWVDAERRAGRLLAARDALHPALTYAPYDPALCHAGGALYAALGYAREAARFFEVVERSGHPTLAADATARLTHLAAEGTEGAKDVAVCVLSLGEVYGSLMTAHARAWPYEHWERACLADPCWVLNPTHLAGPLSGGHLAPPGHPRAFWTVRYAVEALDPSAVNASLGGRFATGDVLVFLEHPATTMPLRPIEDADRLGTLAPRRTTALERCSDPMDVARCSRVYVVGRVDS